MNSMNSKKSQVVERPKMTQEEREDLGQLIDVAREANYSSDWNTYKDSHKPFQADGVYRFQY